MWVIPIKHTQQIKKNRQKLKKTTKLDKKKLQKYNYRHSIKTVINSLLLPPQCSNFYSKYFNECMQKLTIQPFVNLARIKVRRNH